MNDERKKATPAGASVESSASDGGANPSLAEMRDARPAALNLIEDALGAKRRVEELHAELLREVDKRARAEAALRESEEKFRILANTAPALVWFDDPQGNCRYVNQQYVAFSGMSAEELQGTGWQELVHGDDREKYFAEFRSATLERESFHSIVRLRRYDGEWRRVESFAQPLLASDGTLLGQVGISLDISDRVTAERQRWELEERLRLVTGSFRDFAIFSLNTDGVVVTWNPGAKIIFGYSENEMIGRNGRILFVPEDQASGAPEHEMETARTKGRAADERWHLRKDGSRFYASGIMAPLHDNDGRLVGYAKIARDLTEQKRAEQELRRQHEELEAIVAGRTAELAEANEALRFEMAQRQRIEEERIALLQKIVTSQEDERRRIARDMHDSLGQQLTALRLKLASMKNDGVIDGRIAENLETLQEMGRRIDSEVNFLVWELRPTVLDDLGLVSAIESYFREWSKHFGIPAEFHAGAFPRNERLDPITETNLYRITQECLNNVYKHAKAKNASIVVEIREGELVLVIEDDGIGFETEGAGRVHESGRGLGLIGMRERAAIIGGTVEIESANGRGTTVFVRVPLKNEKSQR